MCECFKWVSLGVIIWLVFLIIRKNKTEPYIGSGLANNYQVYTSGATLRRLAQQFSGTNQGVYTTIHNVDRREKPMEVIITPV